MLVATGTLALSASSASAQLRQTKLFIDDGASNFATINVAGTMAGPATISIPAAAGISSSFILSSLTGGQTIDGGLTLTGGALNLGADATHTNAIHFVSEPTTATDAATKHYVDGASATALSSANSYTDAAIGVETSRAEGAEGTLTTNLANEVTNRTNADAANLTLSYDSTDRAKTAAEGYTDAAITTEVANRNTAIGVETTRAEAAEGTKLPLAGGTMTGDINMGSNAISSASTVTTANLVIGYSHGDGSSITTGTYKLDAGAGAIALPAVAADGQVLTIINGSGATSTGAVAIPDGATARLLYAGGWSLISIN